MMDVSAGANMPQEPENKRSTRRGRQHGKRRRIPTTTTRIIFDLLVEGLWSYRPMAVVPNSAFIS